MAPLTKRLRGSLRTSGDIESHGYRIPRRHIRAVSYLNLASHHSDERNGSPPRAEIHSTTLITQSHEEASSAVVTNVKKWSRGSDHSNQAVRVRSPACTMGSRRAVRAHGLSNQAQGPLWYSIWALRAHSIDRLPHGSQDFNVSQVDADAPQFILARWASANFFRM
jgi:hypothetical protein